MSLLEKVDLPGKLDMTTGIPGITVDTPNMNVYQSTLVVSETKQTHEQPMCQFYAFFVKNSQKSAIMSVGLERVISGTKTECPIHRSYSFHKFSTFHLNFNSQMHTYQ